MRRTTYTLHSVPTHYILLAQMGEHICNEEVAGSNLWRGESSP